MTAESEGVALNQTDYPRTRALAEKVSVSYTHDALLPSSSAQEGWGSNWPGTVM
jgi:hypothetical protein